MGRGRGRGRGIRDVVLLLLLLLLLILFFLGGGLFASLDAVFLSILEAFRRRTNVW
jgi:hypothetical protein